MVRSLTLAVLVFLACYVSAVPSDSRMRHGSNTNGNSGHPSQGNGEREANVSRENGEEVDDEDNDDSRESSYGSDRDDYIRNRNHNTRNR